MNCNSIHLSHLCNLSSIRRVALAEALHRETVPAMPRPGLLARDTRSPKTTIRLLWRSYYTKSFSNNSYLRARALTVCYVHVTARAEGFRTAEPQDNYRFLYHVHSLLPFLFTPFTTPRPYTICNNSTGKVPRILPAGEYAPPPFRPLVSTGLFVPTRHCSHVLSSDPAARLSTPLTLVDQVRPFICPDGANSNVTPPGLPCLFDKFTRVSELPFKQFEYALLAPQNTPTDWLTSFR